MPIKKFLLIILLLATIEVSAQQSLSYTPEKPQAGQSISITYSPSGNLAAVNQQVSLKYYTIRAGNYMANDGDFKKSGNKYVALIPTDTADQLVMLKIFSGDIVDNNDNKGYVIPLYKGDELVRGADYALGLFYASAAENFNVDVDQKKGLEYMEQEFQHHPGEKEKNAITYLRFYKAVHPDNFNSEVQKTIEAALSDGLKDEEDYSRLQSLYALDKLTQQSNFIKKLKEEKYPEGKWTIAQKLQKYMAEKDMDKKGEMWKDISQKIDSDSDWAYLKTSKGYYESALITDYFKTKDWDGLKKAIQKWNITGSQLASRYNSAAWAMQEKDEDLKQALYFASIATNWAEREIKQPTEKKPDYLTESEWKESRERTYAMYADSYAMVEYKLGDYKNGLKYAEDAAVKVNKLKDASLNNTYALLASKVLPPKKFLPSLEKMIKEGKATSDVKNILKENYLKKNSEAAYEKYIAGLEKERIEKITDELKKAILNEESPAFSLKDMDGNEVNVSELKGKVLVVDFWATWCGPCKASFPGMQKMVTKYKNDPGVQFLFIDTWENEGEKEKNAKNFITENKYDFHVLMDNDNKVVEKFKVSGIPTKFVIDKNGKIRFKSVGFNGSDDGLVQELSIMIGLARDA